MTSLAKGIWNMGRIQTLKAMLLAAFISVEMLAVLIAVGLALWLPTFVSKIGGLFTQGWEMYCVLVGLPLSGLFFGYKSLHSLLHPKDADRKSFYRWPDYSLLRYYGYIPLLLCVLGVGTALMFLVVPQSLPSSIGTITGPYAFGCSQLQFGDGCSTYRCFAWWC